MKPPLISFVLAVVITLIILAVRSDPGASQAAPGLQALNGVSVTPNGTVRVDAWTCYKRPPAATPTTGAAQPDVCPDRIDLGADLPPEVPICVATRVGQTCVPLSKVAAWIRSTVK